jgi:DNA modification methylase
MDLRTFYSKTMVTLTQGDCFQLIKTLPDNSIDLVITSPPYADLKTYGDFKGIPADDYVEWILPLIHQLYRVLKPTGSFILNINDKVENRFRHPFVFDLISRIHRDTKFKMFERLFWNKMKGSPSQKRFGDRVEFVFWFVKSNDFVFNIDAMRTPYSPASLKRMSAPIKSRFNREGEQGKTKEWKAHPQGALPSTLVNISSETKRIADTHIAVFPESLVEYFVLGSTNPDALVLDPFLGTGTTAVVCKAHTRRCVGFELNTDYLAVAKARLSKTE